MEEYILRRLEQAIAALERMRLDEYVEYVSNRRRMVWHNILYGMFRGLGFTLGFSVLGAFILALISRAAADDIPLIGGFLSEVTNAIGKSR